MQINVLSVTVNTVPTAKGSYQVAEIAYKDLKDGKVNGKKIMSFTNKEVFKAVSDAKTGETYEVGLEKDDKGYWQWNSFTPATASEVQKPTAGFPAPKSNYETPEERKQRQDFIIRQSSLTNAIATLKTDKTSPKVEEVLALAEQYVGFVYAKPTPEQDIKDMSDDIPF